MGFFFLSSYEKNQELVVDSEMFSSQFPARVGFVVIVNDLVILYDCPL